MRAADIITQTRGAGTGTPVQATDRREDESRSSFAAVAGAVVVGFVVLWGAYEVANGTYYTPRSNFGFSLGVAGSLMMLALLTYPLRKRLRWMQRWGALKHWFRVHMWLGLLGPTLVLFHSTFHVRSTNAAVALFSMLFVVASGMIGRFVYTQVHYGLYGRRATLEKLQEEFLSHADAARSRLHVAPQVADWIQSFEQAALERERAFPLSMLAFLGLGIRRRWVAFRCSRRLRRIWHTDRDPVVRKNISHALPLVSPYLREVQRVAQFKAYERLFSLWHVLHVPLIYLLAASTVVHVIAVYMY